MDKKDSFECNHCGFCCKDMSTQINLTLLDIKWLSDTTKMSVKTLFLKKIIEFTPFIRPESLSIFDVEIGMKRPCPLYKNNKCAAYEGRPMNCRIFPYWFITNKIEDSLSCIQNIELSPEASIKYMMYERIIGEMIMKQSKETEEFMKKISATQIINLSNYEDIEKSVSICTKKMMENNKQKSKFAKKLMVFAEKKVDKKILNTKIDLIEKEIKKLNLEKEIDMLINAEALLDGEITDVNVSYDANFQNP